MSKLRQKDDLNSKIIPQEEIRKGLNKFLEFLKDNPDLNSEITLEDHIFGGLMCEILNSSGVKNAYQIEAHIGGLTVDMNDMNEMIPQIDKEGELIDIKKEEDRFRIIVKNSKGQIKMHFLPENAAKRKQRRLRKDYRMREAY